MELKFDRFLKASWNAIFLGQEARQEAEGWSQVGSDAESAGRGEDYGGAHKAKFEGDLIRTLHKNLI